MDSSSSCGPAGEQPPIYEADAGQADRLCREALAQPDRHAALRLLRDVLPSVETRLPGLRNEGFLATHLLEVGERNHAGWLSADANARRAVGQRGEVLLAALGYEIERGDHGAPVDGWVLGEATAVSSDGLPIVGNGAAPDGMGQAWRAQLDRNPLVGDTNGDEIVNLGDLNNVRNNFDATATPVLGDTNADCTVDLTDLNNVRNNFDDVAQTAQIDEVTAGIPRLQQGTWSVNGLRSGAVIPIMWRIRRPTAAALDAFVESQSRTAYTYRDIGGSRDARPVGFDVDHHRTVIGRGTEAFAVAHDLIRAWRQFPETWTAIHPRSAPLTPGQPLAMVARVCGAWWLNACRIAYVVDESRPLRRFGFGYGTLPAHVESGEERFLIELDAEGTLWYDIRSFSRPRFWLARMCYPLVRRQQQRFVHESSATMAALVAQAVNGSTRERCP